ncbi:polysaccharide deacetylase family protein, PEP-CTERM locus subfamily [Desulfonatronum thiosulfatophilum]|uniref:Polysaccharide deacetylase family protein, PEP-CTERM locus subfamily n=1 Tax=Desulfonatronum thiosulfatophilum TaxID=617002 RepID=A0A1G6EKU7_9BACT|nr:XrtA system polysaccharide deacetylase [Desulfonatronum thiosulfatophilum]SDB58004.1 polysaccharide deacetylase family protein, PEP-CTERM locus subfamily [Desulfonatronum thiosulfatophilum]
MQNYLTIDVEDYFQVNAFSRIIKREEWDHLSRRVTTNTSRILQILDKYQVTATFFILGWIAEKEPDLVRRIAGQGHVIGCHSYWHRNVFDLTPEEFRTDTERSKTLLEQLSGGSVTAYRAPSYSITSKSLWALDILHEVGFSTDSSIFPIHHDTYGIPDAPRFQYDLPQPGMVEFPVSTAKIMGKNIPVSGGGYFRLFPYWFSNWALKRINTIERRPFIFYLHPWEIDPEQPRFNKASPFSRFRHYNNLDKTQARFCRLLRDFSFGPLPSGHEQDR